METMTNDDYDYLYKILLVGDSGVGKSCVLLRFADQRFSDAHLSTIGVDFKIRNIRVKDKVVKLQIWDTAGTLISNCVFYVCLFFFYECVGQERFRTITSSYYRGAHGIIVVYDISEEETFDHIPAWLDDISHYANPNAPILLIGNKLDLETKRQISHEQAKEFADRKNMITLETSAKDGVGVNEAFQTLVEKIMDQQKNPCTRSDDSRSQVRLQGREIPREKECCG